MSGRTVPASEDAWRRAGSTTLLLARTEDGRWRATQEGVEAAGYGESAALAAAEYCRRLAER